MKSQGKLKKEEIIEMENELSVKLPIDYAEYMKEYDGGEPEEGLLTLKIQGTSEELALQYLMGYKEEGKFNIIRWNNKYRDDIGEDVIVIGIDVGGGVILLECGDSQRVLYYDDSYELEESTDEGNTYVVSESFEEFLKGLIYRE